jgi:hypothetical protein
LDLYDVKVVNLTSYLDVSVYDGNVTVADTISPEIFNLNLINSSPLDTDPLFGWINISCSATDNMQVNEMHINITKPDNSYHNLSMSKINPSIYYFNSSALFSIHGTYDYRIWANDSSGNKNSSVSEIFIMPPNYEINLDGNREINILDLNMIALVFGDDEFTAGDIREDVTNDGVVDILDLNIVAYHFGESW